MYFFLQAEQGEPPGETEGARGRRTGAKPRVRVAGVGAGAGGDRRAGGAGERRSHRAQGLYSYLFCIIYEYFE